MATFSAGASEGCGPPHLEFYQALVLDLANVGSRLLPRTGRWDWHLACNFCQLFSLGAEVGGPRGPTP